MAINDISMLATAEKDSFLAFKDNNLPAGNESGDDFLSQLQDADKPFVLPSNSEAPSQAGSLLPIDDKQLANSKKPTASLSDDTQDTLLSGDSVLAQINSSQVIDVSVKKHGNSDNDFSDLSAKKSDKSVSFLASQLGETGEADAITTKAEDTLLNDNNSNGKKSAFTNAELETKAAKQSAGENLAPSLNNEGKGAENTKASGTVLNAESALPISDADIEQLAKELTRSSTQSELSTTSKVLNSLSEAQRAQLNEHVKSSFAETTPSESDDRASSVKQLLTEFVVQNEKAPSMPGELVQSQLKNLNSDEKQALLSQLKSYVSNEQPTGDTLKKVNETISNLQTMLDTQLSESKAQSVSSSANAALNAQQASNAAMTANTTQNKAMINAEAPSSIEQDGVNPEELNALKAEQESLLKEPKTNTGLSRVAQVFTLITDGINNTQAQINTQYDNARYEQSILESQAIQSQQLQSSTAQVKQVNIDASMMQAINIVKSDAAKMLQERVSSMLSISNKEAEIRLDPPEMGSMQIRIRSDAEQAQINFVVQNQQAKEALEQSMPRLREMLAEQGIDLGESTISYGQSGSEQSDEGEGQSQGQTANKNTQQDKNDEQDGANPQSSRQQTSSSIDYYA
ncbi:flagellar hook-length control protein FliK [Pseudoalteromonas sp. A3]|uniref:flagellar hook-length control protein FliK n=1 Tax=unclassified Pseudoalteromonas TaxID=194690 RepID=UPI0020BEDB51|nr:MULTISPECIES: flagellar hook-length control protein FliK [unclassified Pseudoalteromonas]MCK8094933.1 flagellar hook-length control protein FliK [Pseudoalteromonas sp. 1CM17D]MCW1719117.1 flagellar hook-length control protein FliK [Pseudoalteromonas sp. A3]